MGSFIAIACVIWLLYKGVKMLARTLYKTEPISAKPDRDAWGRKEGEGPLYRRVNRATKDEDDEGLFQSINRRQQATASSLGKFRRGNCRMAHNRKSTKQKQFCNIAQ